jgi:hypothetical protein
VSAGAGAAAGGHMNQTDPQKHRDNPVPTIAHRGRATSDQDDEARMSNEGGTEGQVGDRSGPGAGYDGEPVQVKDKGGVQ